VVYVYVVPELSVGDPLKVFALQGLILCTMLAMIAGGYIIWDLGRNVARIADWMATQPYDILAHRTDEIGTLLQSFGQMLSTVEHHAVESNGFSSRLDAAYKALAPTNFRLNEHPLKDEVTCLDNRRLFTI